MTIPERIAAHHEGRDPERLALKYNLLESSATAFFRGTAFLFFEELGGLPPSPAAWICGDAHMENFGVYKGDNRLVYFDLNDFDEAALAPALWELLRMLTSIFLSGKELNLDEAGICHLAEAFVTDYAIELCAGKPRWVERSTAVGGVRDLLHSLKGRSRKDFLKRRTLLSGGFRTLRTDGDLGLPLLPGQWEMLREFMHDFGSVQGHPKFFELLSASRRIAGNGSLGVDRFALLVEGKGSPDHNFILDLKLARPSVVRQQSIFASEADRVVSIQRRMQAVSPAFLHAVSVGDKSYVLRELLPREDRVRLRMFAGNEAGLQQVLQTEAHILAWAQLRSSGRQGSDNADTLIAFGQDHSWHPTAITCARDFAAKVKADFKEFKAARAEGWPN